MPDSVLPPPDLTPEPELVAGRYALLEVIGQGGMATVYRARDLVRGVIVAVKRLHAHDAAEPERSAKARTLFEREYHVLSQLAHPRVVHVDDYQVDARGPFYTMELLDGGDLHALAPLDWRKACGLLRDVCSAVALVHSRRLVHRDLSPRNVRCTTDGQAKLIDFGAMAPMGPVKQVIGTPPICAPEVLNLEPLDARTDLYSLGATLYHALTGRHAYPAHDFRHLRRLWEAPFAPPSALAEGVPAELDALVMSLLSLDPAARPASAAEVLDRLSAIAGLPADEQLHVSHAYLHSPMLVGRTASLLRVRKKLTRAVSKRGSSTLVLGAPGVGRSRFFAACVLEAKLLGLTALRADAVDGQRGDYGGVRALATQLFDTLPELSLEAARPLASVLAHAIPELLERLPGAALEPFADPQQKRPRVQQALREWLSEVSKHKPLLVAIDDVDSIDEPSSALAALLTNTIAKHAIVMIVTAKGSADRSFGAMKMLSDASTRLTLENLDEQDTADLVGSLFGEVPHVEQLAHKMFATAQGNPRDTMELTQHLVDRGAIRYVAGSWTLPVHFNDGDLPQSIAQAHRARIAALGSDSKALVQALALVPDLQITFEEGQALSGHGESSRMLRSLDELLVAGVLASSARRFALAQRDFTCFLKEDLADDSRRAIHLRLAALFEARGEAFRIAQQLMLAGEEDRGVGVLLEHVKSSRSVTDVDPEAYNRLLDGLPSNWAETYFHAVKVCKERGRPRSEVHDLFTRMTELSPGGTGETTSARAMLAQLKHDAGIDLHEALDPSLDPLARLGKSFELAQQRHLGLPESERVFEAKDALRPLARACIATASYIGARIDFELWAEMPSLKPYEPLSPAFGVVELLNRGLGARITARFEETRTQYEAVIARVTQPDGAGLDTTYRRHTVMGVTCALGMIEAPMGLASALERARALASDPMYQVNVALIEMIHHLWQGDVLTAEKRKQEVEMLRLQQSGRSLFEDSQLMAEVSAYAYCDDLTRVKHAFGAVARMADNFPGWVPVLHYARGEYHRIRGGHAAALAELTRALELTQAGRHQLWCEIASAHLRVLDALGQHEAACEAGERYLQEAQAAQIQFGQNTIKLALSCAHVANGDRGRAESLADQAIDALAALGSTGLNVGLAYEARARVALRAGDREGFPAWAKRCGDIFRSANNRALVAKHERLMRESRGPEAITAGNGPAALLTGPMAATHIAAALSACPSPRERARLGLDFLIARSGAIGGFLYAIEPQGPVLVAQSGMDEPPSGLTSAVAEHLRVDKLDADTTGSEAPTTVDVPGSPMQMTTAFTSFESIAGDGRELRPCLVGHAAKDRFAVTGLAIMVIDSSKSYTAPADVAGHLSRSWFETGDVTSITAWLSSITAA
jgi:tRNA A-37 threonylcarbamoyl transferase component Bud32